MSLLQAFGCGPPSSSQSVEVAFEVDLSSSPPPNLQGSANGTVDGSLESPWADAFDAASQELGSAPNDIVVTGATLTMGKETDVRLDDVFGSEVVYWNWCHPGAWVVARGAPGPAKAELAMEQSEKFGYLQVDCDVCQMGVSGHPRNPRLLSETVSVVLAMDLEFRIVDNPCPSGQYSGVGAWRHADTDGRGLP